MLGLPGGWVSLIPFAIPLFVYAKAIAYYGPDVPRSRFAAMINRIAYVIWTQSLPLVFLTSVLLQLIGYPFPTTLFLVWCAATFGGIVSAIIRFRSKIAAQSRPVVGFFHPHCDQRAGGERVMWQLVETLLATRALENLSICIYTNALPLSFVTEVARVPQALLDQLPPNATPHAKLSLAILYSAAQVFGLPQLVEPQTRARIEFVFLSHTCFGDAQHYPFATLIAQGLGATLPATEALLASATPAPFFLADRLGGPRPPAPLAFIDTAGYPLALPCFSLSGSAVGCYVHYPVITEIMLEVVKSRSSSVNNSSHVARSTALTNFKVMYYRLFAALYRAVAPMVGIAATNSSWTQRELARVWKVSRESLPIVYPPCAVKSQPKHMITQQSDGTVPATVSASTAPSEPHSQRVRCPRILSLGQFRPEKQHRLQVEAFARALEKLGRDTVYGALKKPAKIEFHMIGTFRPADADRVNELKELIKEKGMEDKIKLRLDVPKDELDSTLQSSLIGLHCMRDEHFGIAVVEFLDAGLITVAHNSAGPQMDIIVPAMPQPNAVGYLADSVESYADAIVSILQRFELENKDPAVASEEDPNSLESMRLRAQSRARSLFSEACFKQRVEETFVKWLTDGAVPPLPVESPSDRGSMAKSPMSPPVIPKQD